ncbi:pyridoxamine 5'-phosphate oxidase family protein [Falsibacillus albus]|uniref:General stress protein n=1 Tax=Falsibacillus albus TaxID=2478915 RepID=A0A3L7JXV0_9BACI|nr:pyridoxamine 5'-phosphate oxidase family protein [Falsibacillus albus]RLQ94501.1 general stress protein [Falsibacillus albus]
MNDALKEKILSLMDDHHVGTLATIQDSKPFSRFMMFFHDDLTLYTATNQHAHKANDLTEHPDVHILLGYEGKGLNDSYAEIEAVVEKVGSVEMKRKYWHKQLQPWITGPDDPDYLLLKLSPKTILYYDHAGSEPQELAVGKV